MLRMFATLSTDGLGLHGFFSMLCLQPSHEAWKRQRQASVLPPRCQDFLQKAVITMTTITMVTITVVTVTMLLAVHFFSYPYFGTIGSANLLTCPLSCPSSSHVPSWLWLDSALTSFHHCFARMLKNSVSSFFCPMDPRKELNFPIHQSNTAVDGHAAVSRGSV